MSMHTTNLGLNFLQPGQAQKHVTLNEGLLRLDALVQLSVVSGTTAAEPAASADGAVYILPAGKSGASWSAFADAALAYYRDGAWEQITPREGWLAWVCDAAELRVRGAADWTVVFALEASFSAHRNGVDQTGIASSTFTKIAFTHADGNAGGWSDTTLARWTPPAGHVRLSGAFYVATGGAATGLVPCAIRKNGALFRQGIFNAGASAQAGMVTASDAASGTDYYELFCFAPAASNFDVAGTPANTYFQGERARV